MGLRWYLLVVLICICLILNILLCTCRTFVYLLCRNILSKLLFIFNWIALLLSCSSFSISGYLLLIRKNDIQTFFFFHSVGYLLTPLIMSFEAQFFVFAYVLGIVSKKQKPFQCPVTWSFSPMFSSKSFIVLALTFRSLIHLELISIYDVRSNFIFCMRIFSFPNTICWKDFHFSIEWSWHFCQKSFDLIKKNLFLNLKRLFGHMLWLQKEIT